ncbi:MAG: exodeoxyribonuclease VII large subunit [Spirochaetes bacterium]|nr:exodeoxyribonuclease VII large subunit [Spirochaetota bacterium]
MQQETLENKKVTVYSVSQITAQIKNLLKINFTSIHIKGEISNFKHYPSSGHSYFDLKDEKAIINCVIWAGDFQKIKFKIENGLKVVAMGALSVYEPRGIYNFIIKEVIPEGKGELQLAFEQLKEKLQKEGLFAPEHKKALPEYPARIGIITGLQTAALRDILNVINRRCPGVHMLIYPAVVQGDTAAGTIVKGISVLNKFFPVDVIILARGGGSIEDLWPFNEEKVVRAIYHSDIPVITGVGHEIDYTISDFAADHRAPTPSAAAELVVKNVEDVKRSVEQADRKLRLFADEVINNSRHRFDLADEKYRNIQKDILKAKVDRFASLFPQFVQFFNSRISEEQHRLQNRFQSFQQAIRTRITAEGNRLEGLSHRCALLNPFLILERGYSVTYKMPEKIILKDAEIVRKDDELMIRLFKGVVECKVL